MLYDWFSPHPWGWTDKIVRIAGLFGVFPTPVGMDRNKLLSVFLDIRFPHTRGDGPHLHPALNHNPVFSPHPWGWTGDNRFRWGKGNVFPTPVGMDRAISPQTAVATVFPTPVGMDRAGY